MWHNVGHTSKLNLSWDKRGNRAKRAHFPVFDREREEKREIGDPRLLPKIYKVPLISFRQAKNKSSSHRRGVHVGTWKEEFRRSSKRGDLWKLKLSGLGGFLPVYHAPRGKGFFLPWLTFHLWAGKRGFFV